MLISNSWLYSFALILLVEIHHGSASQLTTELRRLVQYLELEAELEAELRTAAASLFFDGTGDDASEAYEDVRSDATDTTW